MNLDDYQMSRYGAILARYDPDKCRYVADTGYPRLDRVLDGLFWELSAPERRPEHRHEERTAPYAREERRR